MCQGLNSHYFHIIGDKLINPIVGVYKPIISIPSKGGLTIPNTMSLDTGTIFNGLWTSRVFIVIHLHVPIFGQRFVGSSRPAKLKRFYSKMENNVRIMASQPTPPAWMSLNG